MKVWIFVFNCLFLNSFSFGQDIKNVYFLDEWTDTTITAGPENVRFNEVLGFNFADTEYAVIGSNKGAHIIRIQQHQLDFIDFIPGKFQNVTAENRDYAVYENYLYAVCDEGTSSLQIMDLSFLPDSVSIVYDSNALFTTAHTIAIDTLNAKLYACGTNNAPMKIIDISNPINPALITDFSGVSYVHDCYVDNDTAFLNCGFDGLRVYNFNGPPILLGILDFYSDQGYNHSGYMSPSGDKYAFTDETEGTKIKLCYLENYADIKVDALFGSDDFNENIPHEIVLLDNLLFCSYYNEGLRIFDLSGQSIEEIGAYDTYTLESNFKLNGAWGVHVFENENLILISDRQSGLFLFYFPVKELESHVGQNTFITNIPFINQNRILIPKPYLAYENLYFTIATISGAVVYDQQNYLNWVEIPLNLAPGTYLYTIFADENTRLEAGKFVLAD